MRFFCLFFSLAIFISSCKNPTIETELLAKGVPLSMAEYRKEQVSEVTYSLSFEIPQEKEAPITAELLLDLNISNLEHPLFLDFKEDSSKLLSVRANGENIPVKHKEEHLIIASKHLKIGNNRIEIAFLAGELSLNRNEDFLYTLLVPDRARTLFPCFDQPNIKAAYVLNITAPKTWKVLCGAPIEKRTENGDFAQHQFGKTDAMSTYLFSFVAGTFKTTAQNLNGFDMRLLYRENDSAKINTSVDRIFKLHQQSVSFLEEYTQMPFPFQKLDYATIPGFQYGGMEHVGAIQYRESSLFLDKSATENQKLRRAKLIAHETAHMWFGDLVTMDWFNDVWMKEVFANFMADKSVNPAFPEINHELSFMTTHYPRAYGEDRTRGTNPIRQKLNNLNNAGSLYGSIIYNKAPIMMRQLEASMGKTAFQKGIREYIKTYQNDNADWNQLVRILDKNTAVDLMQWSEVWVNQSGRPVFTEAIAYANDGTISSFELTQKAEDGSAKVWPQAFDIAMIYADSVHTVSVHTSEEKINLEQMQGLPKPNTILYNSNGMGYGVFPMDKKAFSDIPNITDEVARGYAYINSYENVLSGNTTSEAVFKMFKTALQKERNVLLLNLIGNYTRNIFWLYFTDEQRKTQQPFLEKQLFQQLQTNLNTSQKKTLFGLFSSIAYSDSGKSKLYQIWNKALKIENLILNEDDYTSLAMNLALYEHQNTEAILEKTENTISNPDKLKRFQFLQPSLSSDVAVRATFSESLSEAKNREKESWVLNALANLNHPLRQQSSIKQLRASLDLLDEIQKTGDIFFPKGWLNNTIGRYSSAEAYQVLEVFLNENEDLNPVLVKKLLQASDNLYRVQQLKTKTDLKG